MDLWQEKYHHIFQTKTQNPFGKKHYDQKQKTHIMLNEQRKCNG